MEITFLGTGTSGGVPLIGCPCEVCKSNDPRDKRLRSSVLIRTDGLALVVDCGPDFRQQMLRENVRKIDAILMTHQHKDHTAGIDDIRSFNFIHRKPVDFYCDEATEGGIREQFSYVFTESNYPFLPKINFHRIDNSPFTIEEKLTVTPIEVMHAHMPVKGFRIHDFTYITDAKTIAAKERDKIRGTKVLVLNALRSSDHPSHLTLAEALAIVEDVSPEQTYFTHISHQLGLYAQVEKQLPPNIHLAYDGLKISL